MASPQPTWSRTRLLTTASAGFTDFALYLDVSVLLIRFPPGTPPANFSFLVGRSQFSTAPRFSFPRNNSPWLLASATRVGFLWPA